MRTTVVSLRSRIDRIQLWIRQKDDVERVNAIGKKLVKLLDLDREPNVQLEFQVSVISLYSFLFFSWAGRGKEA
jgi:hypothetical protein